MFEAVNELINVGLCFAVGWCAAEVLLNSKWYRRWFL